MNRQETMTKHAVRKAMTASCIMLLSLILWGNRSTCMTVQAVNERQMQSEESTEEVQQVETASEEIMQVQTENVGEAVTQAQTESVEDALRVQVENTEETVQAEDTEEAVQIENVEETVQTQEEVTQDTAQIQEESTVEPMSVTMIGDSVMLGASSLLQEMLPGCVIDAKVSRQVVQADGVLDSLETQNTLGNTIIIALGTNGPFSVERGQKLIDRLGSGRMIYWVTVYGTNLSWQEDSNGTIRALAANNENVHLIEWAQAAAGHEEWLCADGIHLNSEGRAAYAGIVLEGILW